jgi:hypothetical protein
MLDIRNHYTSFAGHRRLSSGAPADVALAVKRALEAGGDAPILVIDDSTGRPVDINTTGSDVDVVARLAATGAEGLPVADQDSADTAAGDAPRGPGRPKLGVVAREVTLLPRHWEWLATQRGGASTTLRRLVEDARRDDGGKDAVRKSQERAYHFMSAMAGDFPGFEEATRALFANDRQTFGQRIAGWPRDVADHATWLAFGA